jgi:hypothetical protein
MEDEIGGACGMDGEKGDANKDFVGKPERRSLQRPTHRWENNMVVHRTVDR